LGEPVRLFLAFRESWRQKLFDEGASGEVGVKVNLANRPGSQLNEKFTFEFRVETSNSTREGQHKGQELFVPLFGSETTEQTGLVTLNVWLAEWPVPAGVNDEQDSGEKLRKWTASLVRIKNEGRIDPIEGVVLAGPSEWRWSMNGRRGGVEPPPAMIALLAKGEDYKSRLIAYGPERSGSWQAAYEDKRLIWENRGELVVAVDKRVTQYELVRVDETGAEEREQFELRR
jgi:hypothetical protein